MMQNNNTNTNNNSNNYTLNTGAPRNVYGHAISGAIGVGLVSGALNAQKVKNENLNMQEAIRDTLKDSLIGGIASATAISVTNNLGNPQKSLFQTLGTLALGAGAVYAVEKAAKNQKAAKIQKDTKLIATQEQENESK